MKTPIQIMQEMGLRVFTRGDENPTYCYFTDGKYIGYAQWGDVCSVSTVHKPNKLTGTGFVIAHEISKLTLFAAMTTFAPKWASNTNTDSVRKYINIDDYLRDSKWNSEFKEVTL